MSARGKADRAAVAASEGPKQPRQFFKRTDVSDDESRYANELRSFIQEGYASALGLRGTMGFESFGGSSSDPTTRSSPAMNPMAHETIVSMRRVAEVWVGLDRKGVPYLTDEDRAFAKEHFWAHPGGFIEELFGLSCLEKMGNGLKMYAQATQATQQARSLGRELMIAARDAEWSARIRAAEEAEADWLATVVDDERHWWRMVSQAKKHASAGGEIELFSRKWDREPSPDEVRAALKGAAKRSKGAGKGKGSSEAETAVQRAFKQAKRGVDAMFKAYGRGRRGQDREEVESFVRSLEVE